LASAVKTVHKAMEGRGYYWSNVAEAYGVYLIGALALFIGCAAILRALHLDGWPDPPAFACKTRTKMPPKLDN